MKINYNKPIRTPRDGAKDLIRRDMLQGAIINLYLCKKQKKETEDYSAHIDIENKRIVVTRFYGVEIEEIFHICDIMKDLLDEAKHLLTSTTNVFLSKRKHDNSPF